MERELNYVVVRTKLQALIALQLVRDGMVSKPFRLIKVHQQGPGEYDPSVYRMYEELEKHCSGSFDVSLSEPISRTALRFARAAAHAAVTGGRMFAASLGLFPMAVAFKIVPICKFDGFDDGTMNVEPRLQYFSEPPSARGAKRAILRRLFPKGAAAFMRTKIERHFTIYPDRPNIVAPNKLSSVSVDWLSLLSEKDRARLPECVGSLLLGTVYNETTDPERAKASAARLAREVDLYLPHPRDAAPLAGATSVSFDAPAESVISYYLSMGSLTVYHFGTSAVLPFANHQELTEVDLGLQSLAAADKLQL